MMSTNTESEEEVGEELQPYAVEQTDNHTLPTVIEWNHGGQRVYVTGTFANWEKKYRLHPRYVRHVSSLCSIRDTMSPKPNPTPEKNPLNEDDPESP
jgi:hypothetical protein